MDPTTVSWVLYALRTVLGYEHVRAAVLKRYVGHLPDVTIGRTFAGVYRYRDLTGYIRTQLQASGRVLLTASNTGRHVRPTTETHYQTFIIDTTARVVTAIDPARRPRGRGIYRPIITEDVVAPTAMEAGYDVVWLETTHACQGNKDDVFCQSWSLFLLIVAVLYPDDVVLVPRAQVDRYAELLSFYKELMELSTVCDELRIEYTEAIARHPDRASLARVDPCMVVRTLAPTDIFDKQ
jgi:hypothetical protein